jgi:hypothetical protein
MLFGSPRRCRIMCLNRFQDFIHQFVCDRGHGAPPCQRSCRPDRIPAKRAAADVYAEPDDAWTAVAKRIGVMQPTTLQGYRAKTHALKLAIEWVFDDIVHYNPGPDNTTSLEWRL